MTSTNKQLWQTVIFLLLSKFITNQQQQFSRKQLINAKNVELAERFANIVGDNAAVGKTKLALNKALQQLIDNGSINAVAGDTMQITDTGFAAMQQRRQEAMTKIAASFPDSSAQKKH